MVSLRRALLIVAPLTLGQVIASADVIQSNIILPPAGGAYTTSGVCVPTRCSVDPVIENFVLMSSNEVGGNQVEVVSADYRSDIYTNNGGSPGTFVGAITMTGTLDITYVGRDVSLNPLGTFTTELTSFDFSGSLNGNTLQVIQNPSVASDGTTTINEVPGSNPVLYDVSSTMLINGELSVNGSPFVPAPPVSSTLTAIPEPQSGSLLLFVAVLFPLAFAVRRSAATRLNPRRADS